MVAKKKFNMGEILVRKKGFLLSVYALLIAELFVTFFIVYNFRKHPSLSRATKRSFLLYLLLSLGLVLVLTLVDMPIWLKTVVFTGLAMVMGAFLHNVSLVVPEQIITMALSGTIGIFVVLSVVGFVLAGFGINLSFMGFILLGALVGLLVATLIVAFLSRSGSRAHKVLLIIGLVLFGVYTMYGTNTMLQKDYSGDVVSAAVDLYLTFLNLFTRILALESME